MAKKDRTRNLNEMEKFQEYEHTYKKKLMSFEIREIDTKYWFKYITKGIVMIFTILLGIIAIHNYANNLPIPTEIKIGIPVATSFISEFPNNLINFFKKLPP